MKNILNIVHSLSEGGAEKLTATLSIKLSNDNNVYILLDNVNKIDYLYKGEAFDLGKRKPKFIFSKIMFYIFKIKKIKELKINKKIDISISHNFINNALNVLSNSNEKKIVVIHNNPFREKGIKSFWKLLVIKYIYKKADYIVTVSNGIKQKLIDTLKFPEEKVKVIYNSFDFNELKELSQIQLEPIYNDIFSDQVIINVARLVVSKGHHHLIKSFKKVIETKPKTKLLLIGDGPEKSKLKQLVKDLKIEDKVYFIGFNKNPYKFILKSDLFVFPSSSEGFGMALVESIFLNTEVIAVDCDFGPREIITNMISYKENIDRPIYTKYGVLMPKFRSNNVSKNLKLSADEEGLATEIIKKLDDITKKPIPNDDIIRRYSIDWVIEDWLSLLK